jgi:hypothetical protein
VFRRADVLSAIWGTAYFVFRICTLAAPPSAAMQAEDSAVDSLSALDGVPRFAVLLSEGRGVSAAWAARRQMAVSWGFTAQLTVWLGWLSLLCWAPVLHARWRDAAISAVRLHGSCMAAAW